MYSIPANTRRWINVGLTLVHRLRRWTNVKPTLIQRRVSAGIAKPVVLYVGVRSDQQFHEKCKGNPIQMKNSPMKTSV